MENAVKEIKKLNFTSAPVINEVSDWQSTVKEVKKIVEKKADSSLVSAEPSEFFVDSNELPSGRFYTNIKSAHLECFFKQGALDYLIVFFSGSRSRGGKNLAPYPTFSSWSWYKDVNASVLCIDDPMYNTYPQIALGWFYGTDTDNFRQDTAVLIKKIASLLGVPDKKIILYGRSGGGTAAVAVSDFIDGCCVCAINAQYDLENYKWYSKEFAQIARVDYSSDEFKKRNDFAGIIKSHPKSTYLLIENLFSDIDMEVQFHYLKKRFNFETRYGINSDSNMFLWLYAAWGVSAAHNSFDSVPLFKNILEIIIALSNGVSVQQVNVVALAANDYWFEHYNHMKKRSQYEKEIARLNKQLNEEAKQNSALKKEYAYLNKSLFTRIYNVVKKYFKKYLLKK